MPSTQRRRLECHNIPAQLVRSSSQTMGGQSPSVVNREALARTRGMSSESLAILFAFLIPAAWQNASRIVLPVPSNPCSLPRPKLNPDKETISYSIRRAWHTLDTLAQLPQHWDGTWVLKSPRASASIRKPGAPRSLTAERGGSGTRGEGGAWPCPVRSSHPGLGRRRRRHVRQGYIVQRLMVKKGHKIIGAHIHSA